MKKLIFLHPFLFALYPVVFLYATNIKEYRIPVLLLPTVLALTFASIVFVLTKLFLKKTEIAAVVSSILIFTCISYNRLLDPFKTVNLKIGSVPLEAPMVFPIVLVIIIGLLFYLVFRGRNRLRGVNKVLTVLSAFLVGFSLITIISYEVTSGRLLRNDDAITSNTVVKTTKTIKNKPDIYYIIFDRYAGENVLREEYSFDNSSFLNFLEKKEFYIASESTSNYPKTFLSLASSLNMEYINYVSQKTPGGASSDESVVTPLIHNNKVLSFLKQNGYKTINLGSWWEATKSNPKADINYVYKKGYFGVDDFTTGFLNTTVASPIFQQIFRDPMDISTEPFQNGHRRRIFYEFNTLKHITTIPGPKFVFAHILLPHEPFVVGSKCEPISEAEADKQTQVENYIEQVQCANKSIRAMVTHILSSSKTPPIIIIQADEGPLPMKTPIPKNEGWGSAQTTSYKEKFPILNAYYLPGASKEQLYKSITPVNSFRVIFNAYFDKKHELLPDKNYVFQDGDHYYKFIEITDKLK